MRRAFFLGTVLGLGVTAMIACGGDDSSAPETDAGPEAGPDTGIDTGIDTGSDTGAEAAIDGGRTLDGGACGGDPVAITSVVPQFAWKDGKTTLTITGTGFTPTPKVYLEASDGTLTQLQHVAFVSSTSLTAVIPAGLFTTPGTYQVAVVDPDTCADVWAPGIRIVADAPPMVLDVAPASGTTQDDVPVTITGCNFDANATVSTVSSMGSLILMSNAAPSCVDAGADPRCQGGKLCTMTATIETKTKTLAAGAYLVRVTNPTSNTFGEYSAFVVTNPSGNLTGGWVAASSLNTGRRSLGLVAGRVDDANRFLYAIGGENASGTALDTIEVGPMDRFGQLGKWFVQKNKLSVARSGLAVTRWGKWIYALGGTSSTDGTKGASPSGTPLASLDRAKILDPASAPLVHDPPTADTTAGSLGKGTWYYEVSAIDSDPDDPGGESLASDEVVATLSANGKVTLTWNAVAGATGFKVYRSPTADGTSQSEVLLASINDGAATSFVDDGTKTPGTEKPMAIGSTGRWIPMAGAFGDRLNAAAVVAPSGPTGAPYLYLLGGWGHCTGGSGNAITDCVDSAVIATTTTVGAVGAFTKVATLANARMRHAAQVMTKDNGPSSFTTDGGATAATVFILVAGGRDAAGAFGSDKNVEVSLVGATGSAGTFSFITGFSSARDGLQFQIANGYGYGYAFQGGNPNAAGTNVTYSGTSDQSAQALTSGTSVQFPNWSNAAANLGGKVGRHGVASESAYFYLAGGTSDDKDALSNVYRVLH